MDMIKLVKLRMIMKLLRESTFDKKLKTDLETLGRLSCLVVCIARRYV